MSQNEGINRRQFLAGSATAALMLMVGAEEIHAQTAAPADALPTGPPVNIGVIGLGAEGRDLLGAIGRVPGAPIVAVCDTYVPAHKRALEIAPTAKATADYHDLLNNKGIDAVFIATPTYLHRQIALDAVASGKHIYLEAPIAHTMEDAKAIAVAGRGSKGMFQVGLQARANPQVLHVRHFIETGDLKTIAQIRAQWHKRTSWRHTAATPDREKDLNWRLYKATSPGLVGEVGTYSIDLANWFLKGLPLSVAGYGGILAWGDDGRDVPDTVQCIIEYPNKVQLTYDATLASSFDSAYNLYMGTGSTILLKDNRGWMFKEADTDATGWEVYARKDKIGDETGIALVADATKQLALGNKPAAEAAAAIATAGQDELYHAVQSFVQGIRDNVKPAAGAVEGYNAAVVAIKANDAINTGTKIVFQKEWFDL